MKNNTTYGIKRTVSLTYEEAIQKVTETLKAEGFGVLTEIDVKATFKKKLDKDFTRYIILGACNPSLAFRALSTELDIGLLLPCNVVVYEDPQTRETIVGAIDPAAMFQITGQEDLKSISEEVKHKLTRAVEAV